jgi:hypothetical protein
MLSENEINDYYVSVKPYFITQNEYRVSMEENWHHTNVLLNNERRIMGIAKIPMTIRSLCGIKYYPLFSFYLSKQEKYDWIEKNKCWLYSKDTNNHQWVNNIPIKSIESLKEYVLINQKIALLDRIHDTIEFQRTEQCKLLSGQETIYNAKYLEAKSILNSGLTKDELLNFPFVSGYAANKEISLQQAAKEIELQYEITKGFLSESENLRIRYTNIVRKETDIGNLQNIFRDFYDESFKYAEL